MCGSQCVRFATFLLLYWCHVVSAIGSKSPTITIVQGLYPAGLRISVTDTPGIDVVVINANINAPLVGGETGKITGSVLESKNGLWTLEAKDVTVKPGDVVFFWVYVASGQEADRTSGQQPIHNLVEPTCQPSPTIVNGRTVCGGELVLEENFDTLNTSLWKHTIQFSDEPDSDFCTYSDSQENSYVKDGILHLRATILEAKDLLIPTKLKSCTWKRTDSKYCDRHPQGWDILPPTRSAQLTTKGTFSFRFGRVDIRTKTAAGDWLMSKLVLDPKTPAYGTTHFESGRIEMLRSRGNPDVLEPSGWQLGARLNDPQVDVRACDRNLWLYKNCPLNYGKLYSEEMRVFSLVWTPESITMTIDGECEHKIKPPSGGILNHPRFRDCRDSSLQRGTYMAPFDREFYIYIGLLVAGFNNYRNEVISKGNPKPWMDRDPRAWLKFWQQRHLWEPTWISDMEVDYVKVWAL